MQAQENYGIINSRQISGFLGRTLTAAIHIDQDGNGTVSNMEKLGLAQSAGFDAFNTFIALDYNDLGITVNYLAFPRGGLNSRSFEDISAVWCSKDQKQAMTDAKAGSKVAKALCSAPIAGHYNLGQAAGVTGTPAIMFEDGTMIPGYKPPSELAQILELN